MKQRPEYGLPEGNIHPDLIEWLRKVDLSVTEQRQIEAILLKALSRMQGRSAAETPQKLVKDLWPDPADTNSQIR